MKNHFVFPYAGNKRQEVERIYDTLDLTGITTIVEPFCGTCAMSFYIASKHPGIFTYVLNDIDKQLIQLLEILKNPQALELFQNDVNTLAITIVDKASYLVAIKSYKTNLAAWYIRQKIYSIKAGLYRIGYVYKFINIAECPIVQFLQSENVKISNLNGIQMLEEHKSKPECCVFLDPPYIMSCNTFYEGMGTGKLNIYSYIHANQIDTYACLCVLVLENTWIIQLLFQNAKSKLEYGKKYEADKRTTMHIILCNRDFKV